MTERPDNAITPRHNEAVTVARSGLVSRGLTLANSAPAQVAQYAGTTEKARLVGVDFDWVTIPAGEFLMGSNNEQDGLAYDDELPQQSVYLPTFRIARVPVTNAQYKRFIRATGYAAPEHWEHGRIPAGKENHPAVNFSWRDAQAFCQWAGVRLPTEAEWEKAARGTDGRIYPWGNERRTADRANFDMYVEDTMPVSVGSDPQGASPFGVYDMAGNVWEWTNSLYRPYPYDAADGREDSAASGPRTLRGGSWYYGVNLIRCAGRSWNLPDYGDDDFGFRLVTP